MELEVFAVPMAKFDRLGFNEEMLTIDGIKAAAIRDQHSSYTLLVAKDSVYLMTLTPENHEHAKAISYFLREFSAENNVTETWFISEMWFVVRAEHESMPNERPSECNDRIEGLLCVHEQPNGKSMQWVFNIVRDDAGNIADLIPNEKVGDPDAILINPKWIIHKPFELVKVIH